MTVFTIVSFLVFASRGGSCLSAFLLFPSVDGEISGHFGWIEDVVDFFYSEFSRPGDDMRDQHTSAVWWWSREKT